MNGELHPLFPISVYKENLRLLSKDELNFLDNLEVCEQTLGNKSSVNTHVLNSSELFYIKKLIEEKINEYWKSVLLFNTEIYITNSWLNTNDTNQQHFLHNHSNSILSGVYYINVEDSLPLITFNRMQLPFLLNFIPKEFTMFNSTEWSIPVENGSLIIFPSTLYHYVKPNTSNKTRLSLAFNTFVKGNIGFNQGSELIL
jgi:uncharacterized protein (TIGR02466 family)